MNQKTSQQAYSALKKLSKNEATNEKLSFAFESDFLNYQSHLSNFSMQHYKIFDELSFELGLKNSIDDLFSGKVVNKTEDRAALHHKYRSYPISEEFNFQMIVKPFIKKIKNDGFQNVITFGIGGSYEGPKLLQEYTANYSSKINYYFISGPDKDEFNELLKPLAGQKNFFIFSSKSLTTDETLACLKWLGRDRTSQNSIVITANKKKAISMGFKENCIVPFPETVGGRYSIWSPISLSVDIENNFSAFLEGGSSADKMMLGKSNEDKKYQKLIKILAFSDLWFSNFKNKKNRVVLSYNWKLRSLANYIQQLEMESLGKKSNLNSHFKETGQSIFGGFGSIAHHSYFQLLHQGTAEFCADIIYSPSKHSSLISAQAESQAQLLSTPKKSLNKTIEFVNGNAPVNLFILPSLKLSSLGFLIATWEHRVFTTASMLQINPFDQFGVKAGKIAAKSLLDK